MDTSEHNTFVLGYGGAVTYSPDSDIVTVRTLEGKPVNVSKEKLIELGKILEQQQQSA